MTTKFLISKIHQKYHLSTYSKFETTVLSLFKCSHISLESKELYITLSFFSTIALQQNVSMSSNNQYCLRNIYSLVNSLHNGIYHLCGEIVSPALNLWAWHESKPKQLTHSPISYSSFFSGWLINGYGGNLWKVNCGTPNLYTCPVYRGNGSLPITGSKRPLSQKLVP